MKIIHCADIHLDSAMNTKFNKEKSAVRKREILMAFVDMVRYARDNGVQAIIIAGDLFDTGKIDRKVFEVVYDLIVKNEAIDFYYLRGNHEGDGFVSRMRRIPDNLLLFGDEWLSYVANDKGRGNIVVTGIDYSDSSISDIYDNLNIDKEDFNIVVIHGEFDVRRVAQKNIDYLALGHIHEYCDGKIDARGIYCYSGCLMARGFDECGRHGFVLIDIDEQTCSFKRKLIQIPGRHTDIMEVDISDCRSDMDVVSTIENGINDRKITCDSVIRVVLCGKTDVGKSVNTAFIEKIFEGRFFYFEVRDNTEFRVDISYCEQDMTLRGEFVRTVMAKEDISDKDKKEIIDLGLKALAGEEI